LIFCFYEVSLFFEYLLFLIWLLMKLCLIISCIFKLSHFLSISILILFSVLFLKVTFDFLFIKSLLLCSLFEVSKIRFLVGTNSLFFKLCSLSLFNLKFSFWSRVCCSASLQYLIFLFAYLYLLFLFDPISNTKKTKIRATENIKY
jgi:hypothetical protein